MNNSNKVGIAAIITATVAGSIALAVNPPVNEKRVGCVRKLPDADCLRMTTDPLPGAKPRPVDPGELNVFPAAQSVGDCEPVKCFGE